jgi:hypothetical protein
MNEEELMIKIEAAKKSAVRALWKVKDSGNEREFYRNLNEFDYNSDRSFLESLHRPSKIIYNANVVPFLYKLRGLGHKIVQDFEAQKEADRRAA